ncbi:MAG: hypothetical protein F4Y54_05690 [Dehalococcoidia bacterium]|nr:hypothetical protein [Dehalococcoidia bacterium]
MRWLRYLQTLPEVLMVVAVGALLLFTLMYALSSVAGLYGAAAGVLALSLMWDLAVERPRRQDQLAEAFAASRRGTDDSALQARTAPANWRETPPGPWSALVRTAPATLAAIPMIAVAFGIADVRGHFSSDDGSAGVYVPMEIGASGSIEVEGDDRRSLRITLLGTYIGTEPPDPSIERNSSMRYLAAEVRVKNTGIEAVSLPMWTLRAKGKYRGQEYKAIPAGTLGLPLAPFALSPAEVRTGWVIFEVLPLEGAEWYRARLPGYPDLYFAIRSIYEEKTSP